MRRHLKRDNIGRDRHGFSSLPRLKLSAMGGQIGRCVKELPVEVRVAETALRTELTESIMYFRMQRISQFAGRAPGNCTLKRAAQVYIMAPCMTLATAFFREYLGTRRLIRLSTLPPKT